MAESDYTKKRVRQPPSVPFLWEEKPGMPKKDWKPFVVPSRPPPPPPHIPVKFVASVPFKWEEKPGTPLHPFGKPEQESYSTDPSLHEEPFTPIPLPPAAAMLIDFPSPPIMDSHYFDDNLGIHGALGHENMFELDYETFDFETETDDSFSSAAPSLLANCLVSSSTLSKAVPVENCSMDSFSDHHVETPSSPSTESESGSTTSSYVTGTSSLVGASFLECLFPLLPPHSSLLEKVEKTEKNTHMEVPLHGLESKEFSGESNRNVMVKREPAPTLGELIMMSRRRSMHRKAIEMRKKNPSMEMIEEKPYGCFGTKVGLAEGLQKKLKWQPIVGLV